MYSIKLNAYWLLVVLSACFYLSGCAGLSDALDLTHTETTRLKIECIFVTDKKHFTEWVDLFRSPDSRVEILSEKESSVQASDMDVENKIYSVSYMPYYEGFCDEFLSDRLVERVQQYSDGIIVKDINLEKISLNNCKKGLQTSAIWETNESSHVANLYFTISMKMDALLESKYKYDWAGTRCADGWISSSTGKGTCSWHGGVVGPVYRKRYLDNEN